MRDLDSMIAEWRRGMKRGGIRSRDELDELEGHLRDDMEHRMRTGEASDRAFALAAERLGAPRLLRDEFQKIQLHQIMNPKIKARLTEVLVVIALIAIQLALLLPLAHKWRAGEPFAAWDFSVLAGWTFLVLAGAIVFAKKRRLKA